MDNDPEQESIQLPTEEPKRRDKSVQSSSSSFSGSVSEISLANVEWPHIKELPEETKNMIKEQLTKMGIWANIGSTSTGPKYLMILSRWHEWWHHPDVKSARKKSRIGDDVITENIIRAFCKKNISASTCAQFKPAMMHLHSKALRKGGITHEGAFWRGLFKNKICSYQATKKGALSSREASSL